MTGWMTTGPRVGSSSVAWETPDGVITSTAVMHRIMYEEPDLSGLPPSLRTIVRECLAKDPARRPSARDLLLRLVDPSAQRTHAAPAVPVDSIPDTGPPTHTGSLPPLTEPTISGPAPPRLPAPGPAPAERRHAPQGLTEGRVADRRTTARSA